MSTFAEGRRKRRDLSEEQKQEIREAFELFDCDKDNEIDYNELKVALRALGIELKKSAVKSILKLYNIKEEGCTINFEHFNEMVTDMLLEREPTDEIVRAFKLFDEDDCGKISFRNLKKISRELGENLTDEELRSMIDEFDRTGDGSINFEEFLGIMTGEI